MYDLYTSATPNGWKVTIAMEEMGLPYNLHPVDLTKGEQQAPRFLSMNPNGRIPVLHDQEANLTIFESGAILLYLADKTGLLIPSDQESRWAAIQWLFFQMGGIGPIQGQAVVFERYFDQDVPEARKRYHNETRRLYEVLDTRLGQAEFLAGRYGIADIANWAWVKTHRWARVPTDGLLNLQRWIEAIASRPAVKSGIEIPPPAGTAARQKKFGAAITTN